MHDYWTLMKKLIWLRILQGASFVVNKITGTSPITLTNAINSAIISLKQYGKCVQDGTPTPSSPVDIKCNNGALRMVHRSGLPSGYKLLEYVGGGGSQYIITDVYLASTDVVECEYQNSSTTGYGAIYGIYKSGESSAFYGNQTYYGYNESNNKVDTGVSVDTEWHSSRHDFVNGTLTIDNTTVNFTPWTFTNNTKNAVLTRFYNGSYGYHWKGYLRKFKVTRGNDVICDLLPAKDSNDVAGMYDLISGNFYTASGGTLLEGNVVDDYYLAVVGTPEVLTVSDGTNTQTASVADLFAVGDYADEAEIISGLVTRKCRAKVLDGTESYTKANSGNTVRFRLNNVSDLITGSGLGRIPAIYSHFQDLSSTSSQSLGGAFAFSGRVIYFIPTDQTLDLNGWKSWVAQQYAAGTPVIVIYPLVQETTEQTTPHELHSYEGDTTVSWTAEVDGTVKTVEYVQGKQASNKVGTAKVGTAKCE